MPIYEFQCPKCGKEFELMRSFTQAETPAICPFCGGVGKRLVSTFAYGFSYGLKLSSANPLRASVKIVKAKPAAKKAVATKKAPPKLAAGKKKATVKVAAKRPAAKKTAAKKRR